MRIGRTLQLKAQKSPKSDDKVAWSSSDKKVATVDKKGLVTAKKAGTATITAKLPSGKMDTCKITVPKVNLSDNLYNGQVYADYLYLENDYSHAIAYFDIYNKTKKKATYLTIDIYQYDNRGKRIKTSTYSGHYLNDSIRAQGVREETGWYVHPNTRKIRACVKKVWFSGGKTWTNPHHKAWAKKYARKY